MEWSEAEQNGTQISFHCLDINDGTEQNYHSIVWKVNGKEWIIIVYSNFNLI
jgi:hypothetical protein